MTTTKTRTSNPSTPKSWGDSLMEDLSKIFKDPTEQKQLQDAINAKVAEKTR